MQSRLFVIFLAVVLLVAMVHFVPKPLHRQLDLDNATCQVFCQNTSLAHTSVGFGKIVTTSGKQIASVLACCDDVEGVSIRFVATEKHLSAVVNKLNLTVHTTQILGELTILCGYSPKVVGGVWLDGHKTNVQIAFDGNTITIGSPLILGDY